MKYRHRVFFSDKQKSEIWDRWQRGESMSSIGRGFDRASSSIYLPLARAGCIRPAHRIRSRLALILADGEAVSRGLIAQLSLRSIARSLKRSESTISREVRRNGGPKPCKLEGNVYLCWAILAKLIRKVVAAGKSQAG